MSATPPNAEKGAGRLVKATVARGRTVFDHDGKRRVAGEEVQLPGPDVARLRKIGFLVDPDKPPVRLDVGPSFGSYAGPQIRRG